MGKELRRPVDWKLWHHLEWNTMHPLVDGLTQKIWKHTRVVMIDVVIEVRRQNGLL